MVRGAIRRALAENEARGRESLLNVVRKMIEDAENGDRDARRELFDRLDGKPNQTVDASVSGTVNVTWPEPKNKLDE
jgi:hypothetical protein